MGINFLEPIEARHTKDIEAALHEVGRRELLAAKIVSTKGSPSFILRRAPTGKVDIEYPWLPEDMGLSQFGSVEFAGPSFTKDPKPHRDFRPANVMNTHAGIRGRAVERFALLPDDLHDENLEIGTSLAELAKQGHDVLETTQDYGDVLIFMGGIVTHEVISEAPDRLSIVKSFRPK